MLTAELVNARRRGAELVLAKMNDETRALAEGIARLLVDLFRTSVGATRDDVDAALAAVEVPQRHQRLKDGLAKLLDDRADWNVVGDLDPERVRREVFRRAKRARQERDLWASLPARNDAIDTVSDRADLLAALGELPERQRTVVVARYFYGLSYDEIADHFEIKSGTVGATLHQAIERLRQIQLSGRLARGAMR